MEGRCRDADSSRILARIRDRKLGWEEQATEARGDCGCFSGGPAAALGNWHEITSTNCLPAPCPLPEGEGSMEKVISCQFVGDWGFSAGESHVRDLCSYFPSYVDSVGSWSLVFASSSGSPREISGRGSLHLTQAPAPPISDCPRGACPPPVRRGGTSMFSGRRRSCFSCCAKCMLGEPARAAPQEVQLCDGARRPRGARRPLAQSTTLKDGAALARTHQPLLLHRSRGTLNLLRRGLPQASRSETQSRAPIFR
jgi:hypothetical protein